MEDEVWVDCLYYPKYAVSNFGNVVRKLDGIVLKQYLQKSGYKYVWLNRGSGNTAVPVHRLVCIAFHGSEGYRRGLFVDHINTIRSDNRADNLHWVTPRENSNNPITLENRKKKQKQENYVYSNNTSSY